MAFSDLPETKGTVDRIVLDADGNVQGFVLAGGLEVYLPPICQTRSVLLSLRSRALTVRCGATRRATGAAAAKPKDIPRNAALAFQTMGSHGAGGVARDRAAVRVRRETAPRRVVPDDSRVGHVRPRPQGGLG